MQTLMNRFPTITQLQQSACASRNEELFEKTEQVQKRSKFGNTAIQMLEGTKLSKTKLKEAKSLSEMKNNLRMLNIPFEEEYRFDKARRFRFDLAIIYKKIGIEYEGSMCEKSRHRTITGFSRDCEKYTLAAKHGWIVLRYDVLTYKNMIKDIEELIKK